MIISFIMHASPPIAAGTIDRFSAARPQRQYVEISFGCASDYQARVRAFPQTPPRINVKGATPPGALPARPAQIGQGTSKLSVMLGTRVGAAPAA